MVVLMVRSLTLIVAAFVIAGLDGAVTRGQTPGGRTQRVAMTAERFSFTPSRVRTKVGTALTISLTSDDTAHGFRIVGTDVNIEIPKRSRGAATVTFTPERAGRYVFECSQLCGAGHEFMRGEIIVSDDEGERP